MTTLRRGYRSRFARGCRVVDGVVVETPVLTAEEKAVLDALLLRRYPHGQPDLVASLVARGLIDAEENPCGSLPRLALSKIGIQALRAAS